MQNSLKTHNFLVPYFKKWEWELFVWSPGREKGHSVCRIAFWCPGFSQLVWGSGTLCSLLFSNLALPVSGALWALLQGYTSWLSRLRTHPIPVFCRGWSYQSLKPGVKSACYTYFGGGVAVSLRHKCVTSVPSFSCSFLTGFYLSRTPASVGLWATLDWCVWWWPQLCSCLLAQSLWELVFM